MGAVSSISGTESGSLKPQIQSNSDSSNSKSPTVSVAEFQASSDAVVLEASLGTNIQSTQGSQSGQSDFQELYKSLSLTAKDIVDKINEQLKTNLPNGVQSLSPDQVTPEATADRIVSGSTAFFDVYAKQHKDLQGEELLNSFLGEIKKGIDSGYNDAFNTLKALGAFQFDGVQKGVETTRSLIDEKLAAFEAQKRKELGLEPKSDPAKSDSSSAAQPTNTQPAPTSIDAIA